MNGKEHAANGDEQGDGREQDGGLVVSKVLVTDQTVHDEDAIVDTNTEYEGGNDDTDEVELLPEDVHGTQDDEPTEQDGHEAKQGVHDIEFER